MDLGHNKFFRWASYTGLLRRNLLQPKSHNLLANRYYTLLASERGRPFKRTKCWIPNVWGSTVIQWNFPIEDPPRKGQPLYKGHSSAGDPFPIAVSTLPPRKGQPLNSGQKGVLYSEVSLFQSKRGLSTTHLSLALYATNLIRSRAINLPCKIIYYPL